MSSVEKEFEDIDFNVNNEPWNYYILDDGTRIKQKFVLTRIKVNKIDEKTIDFQFKKQILVEILYTQEYGLPSEPVPFPEMTKYIIKSNIKAESRRPFQLNEYECEAFGKSFKITIDNSIALVNKTSLFNSEGEPIYLVNSSETMMVIAQK